MTHASTPGQRASKLFLMSMLAGPMLALIGAAVFASRGPEAGFDDRYSTKSILMAGLLLGFCFGFLSAPVVSFCLRRKQMDLVPPVVFGLTLAAVLIACSQFPPDRATWIAFVVYWGSCFAAWLILPNDPPQEGPNICSACGYNLIGLTSDECPECGNAIEREQPLSDL